jgi:hypothetical protein
MGKSYIIKLFLFLSSLNLCAAYNENPGAANDEEIKENFLAPFSSGENDCDALERNITKCVQYKILINKCSKILAEQAPDMIAKPSREPDAYRCFSKKRDEEKKPFEDALTRNYYRLAGLRILLSTTREILENTDDPQLAEHKINIRKRIQAIATINSNEDVSGKTKWTNTHCRLQFKNDYCCTSGCCIPISSKWKQLLSGRIKSGTVNIMPNDPIIGGISIFAQDYETTKGTKKFFHCHYFNCVTFADTEEVVIIDATYLQFIAFESTKLSPVFIGTREELVHMLRNYGLRIRESIEEAYFTLQEHEIERYIKNNWPLPTPYPILGI